MEGREDVQPENIPLVASTDNIQANRHCDWQDTVHLQLLRSTRVLVHLYIAKLIVRLTVAFMESSLDIYSIEIWKFEEEGREVLLLSIYNAIAPCFPLLGGILADTLFGTTWTTIAGSICITIAFLLFTLAGISYEDVMGGELPLAVARTLFVIGLSFVFIGGAGFEANIDPLAAKHKERKGYPAVRTVFHSLFWFETIGIAIAIVINDLLEEKLDFSLFYGIATLLMFVAVVILLLGYSFYIPTSLPNENVLLKTGKAIIKAISRRIKQKDLDVPSSDEIDSFLDYAKVKHGGTFNAGYIDSVKHMLSTLPVFHTITLYSIVYYQVDTSYREQTRRMDLAAGNVEYPNITFQLVSSFIILMTLPTLLYAYPKLDNSSTFKLTPLRKIGIGILFAGLSLIAAAIVETERKVVMEQGDYFEQTVNNMTYNASRLNVLYQLPQYTFIGISEAVIRTSGSELAFTQAPDNMKGIVMGIYLLMSGLGSYLINLIITVIINSATAGNEWITAEMNDGCFECLFYILTGLQLFNLLYLYLISRNYSYKCTVSVKSVYQHLKFNEGEVTVIERIDGELDDVIPKDWEYVATVHRHSLPPTCKMKYGTNNIIETDTHAR